MMYTKKTFVYISWVKSFHPRFDCASWMRTVTQSALGIIREAADPMGNFPLPNGRFMPYKWGWSQPLTSPGMDPPSNLVVSSIFIFIPTLGKYDQIWRRFFQVGWNHQLEKQPKGENIGVAPWYIVTDLDFQRRWTDPRISCKNSHPVHPIDWGHCEAFGTQARTNSGLAFLGSWSFNFHSILFVVGVCILKLNSLNFNAPSF